METEAQKNRASTPTAALESARQLASGSVVPEKWNESASSLQHELRELREPLQLEVPEVAQLLTHVAAVIRASLGVVEQLESHGELMRHTMGAAAGLMVEACGWAVQHGQALQQLGPAALAGSLTTLVLESLGFSRAAMYSPRWLKALGSEGFGSCANTMRASVKDMAALVHGLVVAWWADLESSAGPCADVDALHAVIASGPGGSDLASLVDAAVGQLSALGRDAAQVLTRGDASPEMKSLGTVNVAWGGLMKMMTGLPAGAHAHLLSGKWPALVIEECLGCLRGWLQLFLRLPYDVSKTKVLRFWTMHLTKLLGTHVTCATCFWPQLTALTFEVYLAIASSESDPGACGDLEAHVAPKLIDLMMMCLEEEAQVEGHSEGEGEGGGQGAPSCLNAVTAKVDLLASSLSGCGPTLASAAYSDGPAGPPMPSPRELLSRVQLCCTLLYRSPLLSSAPGLLALATRLLPALLSAASVDLYAVFSEQMHCVGGPRECLAAAAVALVSAASELAQQQQAQTQQQGSGGSGSASAGSVAVKAWREALGALYRAGVSTHPALSHLGGAALAVLVARQHPRDASAQLVDLGTAVRSLAVAEVAVAASADWDAEAVAGGGAREGTDTDAGSSGGEGDGGRNSPGARASTAATTVLDAGPAAGDSPACRTARLLATLAAAAPRGAAAHAAVVLQVGDAKRWH
ncbi:hypothetical protein FOA52_011272 [Chlamydomonas sp. UWO 241]|nr:hypothetical protein FOA52_011272 [Chlamydomonas sp. UWO 241]